MRSQSQHCCFFFFFRDRDILHHLEPPVRKLVVNPSMFGSDDAEDSDDTRATALPGGYFFNVDPDLYIPRSCQSNWWIAGNLISRKQLVYPRRKRWPLGSALRVSLLCQICSFPSGFIVCGSRSLDVRSISHSNFLQFKIWSSRLFRTKSNLSFVKQNRPELFKGQGQQVQETAKALHQLLQAW